MVNFESHFKAAGLDSVVEYQVSTGHRFVEYQVSQSLDTSQAWGIEGYGADIRQHHSSQWWQTFAWVSLIANSDLMSLRGFGLSGDFMIYIF